jgi:hypothetical protein
MQSNEQKHPDTVLDPAQLKQIESVQIIIDKPGNSKLPVWVP